MRRIDTAYDQQGNPYLFTSYADTAGTQIVNQVVRQFNGLGQMTVEYQSVNGPVDLATTPAIFAGTMLLGTTLLGPGASKEAARSAGFRFADGRIVHVEMATLMPITN